MHPILEDDEKTAVGSSHSLVQEVRPQVSLSGKTSNDDRPEDDTFANDWKVTIRKPNFWKFKANPKLQLMQNHISDNWYKGGESNYSWLVQLNLEATYNNKQKVVFTNTLESKLGFLSTQNDEKHKFRTNADMIRMTNKLGLRATKHWYYTFMLQSWTQFYRGYRSNDTKVYSDFMSPFENLFSIGMDYKFNCKNFDMSAAISPIAANLNTSTEKSRHVIWCRQRQTFEIGLWFQYHDQIQLEHHQEHQLERPNILLHGLQQSPVGMGKYFQDEVQQILDYRTLHFPTI